MAYHEHIQSQSSIVSEDSKQLMELIERQKVENEELTKALAERDHQIEEKDNKIKEKDLEIEEKERQIQVLREGLHPATNKQNGEERVSLEKGSLEIVKRNKIEKKFSFLFMKDTIYMHMHKFRLYMLYMYLCNQSLPATSTPQCGNAICKNNHLFNIFISSQYSILAMQDSIELCKFDTLAWYSHLK